MFDLVWSRIVDSGYERCEAILQGYDRKAVRSEVYPVIVPASAYSRVEGIVYFDVSLQDLARLDQFEGEYYFRKTAEIIIPGNTILPAEIYVLKEEYYWIITHQEWDPVDFAARGIHLFMHRYLDLDEQ